MNARQKAKMLKRKINTLESDNDLMRRIIADTPAMQELYDLYNRPVEFKVVQPRIDTLSTDRFYLKELIEDDDFLRKEIDEDIARNLSSNLVKYIVYSVEWCPDENMYHLHAEIKVVSRF